MSDFNGKPFKEAMCIEAMRVFDSCSSQDCLEDLAFTFSQADQTVINAAAYIKSTCIDVTDVSLAISPVAFNHGFYAVDVTYTFRAQIEAYEAAGAAPTVVYGTSSFTKKVILFGSDGGTQRFSTCEADQIVTTSPTSGCSCCCCTAAMPCASVSVAAPMCLDAKLVAEPAPSEEKNVLITIGLFAIIQLSRPVPIMVPVYDYCVPGKECSTNSDSPCEMFEKIAFPTVEFFPRGLEEPHCKEENDTEGQGEAQG